MKITDIYMFLNDSTKHIGTRGLLKINSIYLEYKN